MGCSAGVKTLASSQLAARDGGSSGGGDGSGGAHPIHHIMLLLWSVELPLSWELGGGSGNWVSNEHAD